MIYPFVGFVGVGFLVAGLLTDFLFISISKSIILSKIFSVLLFLPILVLSISYIISP